MKNKIEKYYGSLSSIYGDMYDESKLLTSDQYMADYFRYNLILRRLEELKIKDKILDIGCGEGTPILRICRDTNLEPYAFDSTPEMVKISRQNFTKFGYSEDRVIQSDLSDKKSMELLFPGKKFNASLCLGVMPHVPDIKVALKNIKNKMSKDGVSFISFRNLLFSLFTLNRYSKEFFLDYLMTDLTDDSKKKIDNDLNNKFEINFPPIRKLNELGGAGYDTIPAAFHNPLTIENETREAGFINFKIYFYHFHPVPPIYENTKISKKLHREISINMENNPLDWRGYFMSSAFLLELRT